MAIKPRFEDETSEEILARMLDNINNVVDKRQGSVAFDLTAPAAIEFANVYIAMNQILSYAFISEDMPSDLLTLAASDFGVDRKSATKSEGLVTFTGPDDTLIPAGTQVRTDDLIYFETAVDIVIVDGQFSAEVIAVDGGYSGNVEKFEINTVVGPLAGILEVLNPFDFTGGTDEESDENLLQRVRDKVRKPATSGNVYHYEQWAKEVPGISDARVDPLWQGPGTVRVVLLGYDKKSPDPAIIQDVVDHIEKERPIGATVTVVGAENTPINISADVQLLPGVNINDVIADVTESVTEYLGDIAFKDSVVRYSRIAFIISDANGVVDYTNLTINGGTANIVISNDDVATTGAVTLSAV